MGAADAEPLARLLPGLSPEQLSMLLGGESLCLDAAAGLRLVPCCPEGERAQREAALEGAGKSAVQVEEGFLLKGRKLDAAGRLSVFNALSAVSGLSGIKYFSETRQRETVLLDDVYRTDAPGSSRKLPDLRSVILPGISTFDIHAKDVNFGPTWYRMQIDSSGPGFYLSLVNTKPQKIAIIRAFDSGALSLCYIAAEADEGVYIYSLGSARAEPGAARFVDAYSAALKRLEAVRGWLMETLGLEKAQSRR